MEQLPEELLTPEEVAEINQRLDTEYKMIRRYPDGLWGMDGEGDLWPIEEDDGKTS